MWLRWKPLPWFFSLLSGCPIAQMMEMQLQITPGLKTQPASTCTNLSRVHSSVMVPPSRLLATGKVWETKLSTLLVRKLLCMNWAWMQICKSCRIFSKYSFWVGRNVFQIQIQSCYLIILVLTERSNLVPKERQSWWGEMSETCKPGDAIKIWLDARFARSWQRSLVIAEAGVQVLESGSSRS